MVMGYLPMCYENWQADKAAEEQYLHVWDGFLDALLGGVPTRTWRGVWEHEYVWQTLYFIFGGLTAAWAVKAPRVVLARPGQQKVPSQYILHGQPSKIKIKKV